MYELQATRDGFGRGLVEAAERDERVVALCADLTESTRMEEFAKRFPERFIEVGVAEQNLATVAAGLAAVGKIPFIASYAAFSPGRNYEQIRTTIALNDVPVKIVGAHAGVSVGPDGATHQMLEDIAMMRAMPNMMVIVPCDSIEAQKATVALAQTGKPGYLRVGREKSPVVTTLDTPFELGKARILRTGKDVAILSCGILLYNALMAAEELAQQGIEATVINSPSVKPLDTHTILDIAVQTRAIVTVEEHQVAGGFGSAVAELLAAHHPVPIEFVGMRDRFGESGKAYELIEHFGMGTSAITHAALTVLKRK